MNKEDVIYIYIHTYIFRMLEYTYIYWNILLEYVLDYIYSIYMEYFICILAYKYVKNIPMECYSAMIDKEILPFAAT